MVPSVNLATDSLGLGKMYESIFNAKGTEMCGAKPRCVSFGKNSQCAQKNKQYADCTMKALEVQASGATNVRSSEVAAPAGNSKMLYIILAVIAVIVLIALMRRRSNS